MKLIYLTLLAFIFVLLLTTNSYSQKKLSIGIQIGSCKGFPYFNNGINGVKSSLGVNVNYLLKNNYFFETGLYRNNLWFSKSYGLSEFKSMSAAKIIIGYLLPVRLQKRINIVNNKFFFTPSVGLSYMRLTKRFDDFYWTQSVNTNTHDTLYVSDRAQNINRNLFFLETGIKIEYILKKRFIIDYSVFYSYGLQQAVDVNYTYHVNQDPGSQIQLKSRGNNLQFLVGLRYILIDSERRNKK